MAATSVTGSVSDFGDLSTSELLAHGQAALEWIARYLDHPERVSVLSRVVPGEIREMLPVSPPEHADIVYSHRPEDELPGIIDLAQQIGARAVWCETRSATACEQVESAGLVYVDAPQIADAARANVRRA